MTPRASTRRELRAKEIIVDKRDGGRLVLGTDVPTAEALRSLPRRARWEAVVDEFRCRVVPARREDDGETSKGRGRGKRG